MAKIEAVKTAAANKDGVVITPSEGYDAMLKVILAAEPNFQPENIADGITIWGLTGTGKIKTDNGSDWPAPNPDDPYYPTEEELDEEAEKDDPSVPKEDYMRLEDDFGNVTKGYLYPDFEITYYDPTTTNFKAVGWRRVSKHTTGELAGQITKDDFTRQESGGWNYLKNIRYCTREKLYYKGVEVWPDCKYQWQTLFEGDVEITNNNGGENYYNPTLSVSGMPAVGSTEQVRLTIGGETRVYTPVADNLIGTDFAWAGNGSLPTGRHADDGFGMYVEWKDDSTTVIVWTRTQGTHTIKIERMVTT